MQDNSFDPDLLKQAAAAISESLTSGGAAKKKNKRNEEDTEKRLLMFLLLGVICGHYVFTPGTLSLKGFLQVKAQLMKKCLFPQSIRV